VRRTVKVAAIVALALCGASVAAQQASDGSDEASTTRRYNVTGFDSISSSGPDRVIVSVGPQFSVRAEGQPVALDRIEVVVRDGELEIREKQAYGVSDTRRERPANTFYVTLPRLVGAALAGSGDMSVDRVDTQKFSAALAGSGDLKIHSLRAETVDLSIAGSGDLTARGTVSNADVSIAGSGNVNARDLSARNASVNIIGSGDATLTAGDEVSIAIIGGGDVQISGSARCTVSRLGGGNARCERS
jgi:hypothetical protein